MLTRYCIFTTVLCFISALLLYLGVMMLLDGEVTLRESSPFWLALDIGLPGVFFVWTTVSLIQLVKRGRHDNRH
jgi:hypothetical protein